MLLSPCPGCSTDESHPNTSLSLIISYQGKFTDDIGCSANLFHREEDIADIHADAALEVRLKHDIGAHGLPVAVKCKADEFALGVEDRRAGVAAGDVVVCKEAGVEGAVGIGPLAVILLQKGAAELFGDDGSLVVCCR